MATVKVIQNHFNESMRLVGDSYETTDQHAAQLTRDGLVKSSVKAAPEKEKQTITTVIDKKKK